jgi:hypothetical protein
MEQFATTKVLEKVMECQMKILLLRIAKYKELNEQETRDFLDEYLDPLYYTMDWVRKESIELEQIVDVKGSPLFKI